MKHGSYGNEQKRVSPGDAKHGAHIVVFHNLVKVLGSLLVGAGVLLTARRLIFPNQCAKSERQNLEQGHVHHLFGSQGARPFPNTSL
ncbi:MAG: hypothetical protein B6D34_06630 [Candidatus Brocadia sp. UTAMX1]|jgi:hypothetical protein|nr:MAG: hypothetical protein B6D34_06630 [Candidatus Brocadia sp. UTAMX1]